MPIARYFTVVGGTLLALLLAVNWYFTNCAGASPTLPVQYDRLMPHAEDFNIRIQSDQKWPEKLLFDTELPKLVSPSQ